MKKTKNVIVWIRRRFLINGRTSTYKICPLFNTNEFTTLKGITRPGSDIAKTSGFLYLHLYQITHSCAKKISSRNIVLERTYPEQSTNINSASPEGGVWATKRSYLSLNTDERYSSTETKR